MRMTAVVCTRNRGATESALAELRGGSRLRYVRSLDRGLSNARNLGLRRAQSGKIAMTDDDCTVPVDWLTRMEKALDDSEGVAIVIGNVVTAEYDRSSGFVPSYAQKSSFLATTVRDKHRIEGMAACMGLCADACKKLSGFDPSLGAGSRFHSADETDMIIRALVAGYHVLETSDVVVTHFGLRSWSEAESIVHN